VCRSYYYEGGGLRADENGPQGGSWGKRFGLKERKGAPRLVLEGGHGVGLGNCLSRASSGESCAFASEKLVIQRTFVAGKK